ncbi:MAG TPA: efflux RND transporter periplasmic adaptor subunit [Thermoanaerobaculia bacterium]|nr:efflux RND transporter periplasmic adaptor subunit [Thermoanaerobaculia bacterium]
MKKRHIIYALVTGTVLIITVLALLPNPVPVEISTIERGPMEVTVDARGETRVRERFVITAPISGRIGRIDLREGTVIEKGSLVATIAPLPIDSRQREEAEARVGAAQSTIREAAAAVAGAEAAVQLARNERQRIERLVQEGVASDQTLDQLQTSEERARQELDAARQRLGTARANLAAVQAALQTPDRSGNTGVAEVRSPAAGRIFRIPERSERIVAAGEPIVEVGDARALELVIDVLSEDAVRITPGQRVIVDQWGGDRPLHGTVRLVEPSAFTKISALGIEEQRVNVIVDLEEAPPELGDAYRIEAKTVIWESSNVLKVPISALARADEGWSVFVHQDGRAVRRPIEIGHRNPLEAEVLSGLEKGTEVIVHPSLEVEDGVRVRVLE